MCNLITTHHPDCECVLSRSTSSCSVGSELGGAENWLGRGCPDFVRQKIIYTGTSPKCQRHLESQEEMSRNGRTSLERKFSAGEARGRLGSSTMGLNTERRTSQREAGFGLGLGFGDDNRQLKHVKKRSVAVQAGKVKEMVEKFNTAAILEEAATETNTMRMKRSPSQEHTPTRNIESGGNAEVATTEINQLKKQDGVAEGINKLLSPKEPNNLDRYHLNARQIRCSLRSKDDDTESVQSLTNSDFDEIFCCYGVTQSSVNKEANNSSAVSFHISGPQHKFTTDFTDYEVDISGIGTPAYEKKSADWISPIQKWFASKCNPPETYRGKSTIINTDNSRSVAQEDTFEAHSTSLGRQNITSIRSSNPSIRAINDDSVHDIVQTPDASTLAREYSDLIPHFIHFDETLANGVNSHSFSSSSSSSSTFPQYRQLIPNDELSYLDPATASPPPPRIPIETKPSHNHTLSNTSSTYTSSVYSTDDVSPERNSDIFFNDTPTFNSNNSAQSNLPPQRYHGQHQITDFPIQPRLSFPEQCHFSFSVNSDSLTLPASLSPADEHSARPPSAISNLSGASTIVAHDSNLVDPASLENLLVSDAESGEAVVPNGKSLGEQRIDVYGTIWSWNGTRWVVRGENVNFSS